MKARIEYYSHELLTRKQLEDGKFYEIITPGYEQNGSIIIYNALHDECIIVFNSISIDRPTLPGRDGVYSSFCRFKEITKGSKITIEI